jgi:hypothetical protein
MYFGLPDGIKMLLRAQVVHGHDVSLFYCWKEKIE